MGTLKGSTRIVRPRVEMVFGDINPGSRSAAPPLRSPWAIEPGPFGAAMSDLPGPPASFFSLPPAIMRGSNRHNAPRRRQELTAAAKRLISRRRFVSVTASEQKGGLRCERSSRFGRSCLPAGRCAGGGPGGGQRRTVSGEISQRRPGRQRRSGPARSHAQAGPGNPLAGDQGRFDGPLWDRSARLRRDRSQSSISAPCRRWSR